MAAQHVQLVNPTQVRPQAAPAQLQREELLLQRYRVVESCGNGGFASVEVCWDTRLRRRVAIKRIPLLANGDQAAWQTVNEALNESRTAALLAHPNIVTVFDFEYDAAFAYIVMEYVDGLSLAELLARVEDGKLTPDEAAHVIDSLANALAYAHENGVLHLDIKPANVMIDRTGTVKLGDFGMATLASAAGFGGARGGTVGYMSPEQLTGEYVDERADIFSFAVVCYEMLSGTQPFAAASAEKSLKLIERGCDPLIDLCPEVGLTASNATAAALSAGPVTRPQSIGDYADELLASLGDERTGRDSIHVLMSQVEEEGEAEAEAWQEARMIPPATSFPWFIPACERAAAALVMGPLAWRLITPIDLGGRTGALIATGTIAAASALSPQAGSLLVLTELVWAIGSSGMPSVAFPLATGTALVALLWWGTCGRADKLAGTALLLPALTGIPTAASAPAGYGCSPAIAAFTGLLAPLFGSVVHALTGSGFDAALARDLLIADIVRPATWVVAAGCGLGAWIASVLVSERHPARTVAGQLLCALTLIGALLVAARLENGGTWTSPPWDSLALAVSFSLLMALVSGFIGVDRAGRGDQQ